MAPPGDLRCPLGTRFHVTLAAHGLFRSTDQKPRRGGNPYNCAMRSASHAGRPWRQSPRPELATRLTTPTTERPPMGVASKARKPHCYREEIALPPRGQLDETDGHEQIQRALPVRTRFRRNLCNLLPMLRQYDLPDTVDHRSKHPARLPPQFCQCRIH